MRLTIDEILNAVNGQMLSKSVDDSKIIENIVTDSRKLSSFSDVSSCAFVGIRGERFDGNTFISSAAKLGAGVIITDSKEEFQKINSEVKKTTVILVPDSIVAFGNIALAWRKKLSGTFVAVTGSVGKTTTKEFIYNVVSSKFLSNKTPENHNNEIGVPTTILETEENTEVSVIEMGMRGFHQIEALRRTALPHIAVITNIGFAHMEIMGSKENTLKAKLEIAENMDENDILILNGDDELLSNKKLVSEILKDKNANPRIIYFGMNENCDVRGTCVTLSGNKTDFTLNSEKITLNVPGIHNVYAALAGAAVGISLGISLEEIAFSVKDISNRTLGRQEIKKNKEITVIDDCYNAGPESVKASLSLLKETDGKRKVAFLGDMLELGVASIPSHIEVGEFAGNCNVELLVCVGENARNIGAGAKKADEESKIKVIYYENSEACANEVKSLLEPGDVCLVKGSHAMNMEKITSAIMAL